MLAARPGAETPIGARDRTMLLLGFGAALRRSELAGLRLGDVIAGRRLRLLVWRSKTDQAGRGQDIAVCANPADPAFCPAAALNAWLAHRRPAPPGSIRGGFPGIRCAPASPPPPVTPAPACPS